MKFRAFADKWGCRIVVPIWCVPFALHRGWKEVK